MALLSGLESRLGLTRGDVTVTLFVALAALGGFIYITFFDSRSPAIAHQEMMALTMRHDSIVAGRKRARLDAVARVTAVADTGSADTGVAGTRVHADSVARWKPLTPDDTAADEALAKAEKPAARGGAPEKGSAHSFLRFALAQRQGHRPPRPGSATAILATV